MLGLAPLELATGDDIETSGVGTALGIEVGIFEGEDKGDTGSAVGGVSTGEAVLAVIVGTGAFVDDWVGVVEDPTEGD